MTRARLGCFIAILVSASLASRAFADNAAKVEAETLFQRGRELLASGSVDEACKNFEASQTIDRALGTMLRLADCYERSGRTASAWALFREAASVAGASGQAGREEMARTRADALEPKLARLELHVRQDERVPGLELTIAGVAVPEATWGVALPVDPGTTTIRAVAPGRVVWTKTIELPRGGTRLEVVEVPPLELLPKEEEPEVARPAAPLAELAPSVKTADALPRNLPADRRGAAQRAIGVVTGGIGLGAVTVGGILGIQALLKNRASLPECRPNNSNLCTSTGVTLRRESQGSALGSTVALPFGVAVLATGVVVFLTAPKRVIGRPTVLAVPVVTTTAVSVVVGGTF